MIWPFINDLNVHTLTRYRASLFTTDLSFYHVYLCVS